MGVDRTDYLMVGVEVDMNKFDYGKFEDEINGSPHKRFDIVYDGMCGEYCIAGRIYAQLDESTGEGFEIIKIDDLEIDKDKLSRLVSDAFEYDVPASEFSLMLFSHYH